MTISRVSARDSTTPVRVLLADPDPSTLALYSLGLSGIGFEVDTAGSGLDCVGKLVSFDPDILVLEPELLWGGGAGVLARMREDEDVPSVPVIVLYANASPQVRGYLSIPPVRAAFPKPVTVRSLAERINHVLERKPSQ